MKNNIKIYSILGGVLVSLFFAGCKDDFLNVPPKDRIVASNFFTSVNDLEIYTNGFYKWILTQQFYFRDAQSDNVLPFSVSSKIKGTRLVPVAKGSGGWSWSFLRQVNYFLGNYKRVGNITAAQPYVALARFFRAWFYYRKVAEFGDVPWYGKVLAANDSALYKPRTSREIVMDSILADINYAIKYLPEKVELYNITKYTALALKARICLFGGTYREYHQLGQYKELLQDAVDASKAVIDSKAYSLYKVGGPDKAYRNLFALQNQDPTETILAINFAKNISMNGIASYMTATTHGGWGMTQEMVNTYLMKDGSRFTDQPNYQTMGFYREMQNRDPRLTQTIAGPNFEINGQRVPVNLTMTSTGYRMIKALPSDETEWGGNADYNDVIVFRYAEELLIYAEAKAELGTITQNDLDISVNKLRARVGIPPLNLAWANAHPDPFLLKEYPNVNEGSDEGVILAIRRARRVELFNEGFRWDDLMRWADGAAIELPMEGIYFPGLGAYDFNNDGTPDVYVYDGDRSGAPAGVTAFINVKNRKLTNGTSGNLDPFPDGGHFTSPKDYLYPIPTEDLDLNPKLVQNPGWGE